ncbi:MAG: thioredoxin [Alloprevotella sp.]|nr:thioredoxin [Alloprevotella sp.]
MEITITDQNFENQLEKGLPLIIDFSATWCGPCRMMAPIISELSDIYAEKIIVGKVDVDENPDICAKYGIRNIPTILFFKNGEVVDKVVGAQPKSELEKRAENLL